jgi:hypothetical protein
LATAQGPIRVQGLRDLQRAFRHMEGGMHKEIRDRLKSIGTSAAERARGLLRERSKHSTGRMAGTIKTSVRQNGVSIVSSHPGAPVQHWGGSIRPRGTPIHITAKYFAIDAAASYMPEAEERLGQMIDDLYEGVGGFH